MIMLQLVMIKREVARWFWRWIFVYY